MKKLFKMMILTCMLGVMCSCEYDDSDLWNKVNDLEQQVTANSEDLAVLSALVDALNKGKVILDVEQTEEGYTLTFSDGSKVEIKNGEKGDNGEDGKDGDSFFVSIDDTGEYIVITLADGRVLEIPKAYQLRVLTFEDADYKGSAENAATYWSDFIPNGTQYGSGHGSYSWHDEGNTELEHNPISGQWGAFAGHAGISNYTGSDCENHGNYNYDLQAYKVAGGHSGNNFNTHYGYKDDSGYGMNNNPIYFNFADGVERIIDHMWVTNTTYAYHSIMNGDGQFVVNGADDNRWVKIVATGFDSDDNKTGTTEFFLLNTGKRVVTEWTKWDLSSLGKVFRVEFNVVGSDDLYGSYGFNAPAYFAYDDVCVRF